jgi:hypothetical protein
MHIFDDVRSLWHAAVGLFTSFVISALLFFAVVGAFSANMTCDASDAFNVAAGTSTLLGFASALAAIRDTEYRIAWAVAAGYLLIAGLTFYVFGLSFYDPCGQAIE